MNLKEARENLNRVVLVKYRPTASGDEVKEKRILKYIITGEDVKSGKLYHRVTLAELGHEGWIYEHPIEDIEPYEGSEQVDSDIHGAG